MVTCLLDMHAGVSGKYPTNSRGIIAEHRCRADTSTLVNGIEVVNRGLRTQGLNQEGIFKKLSKRHVDKLLIQSSRSREKMEVTEKEESPQGIPFPSSPTSPTSPRQPGSEEPLSHMDAMAIVRKELSEILDDPLLEDLPQDVCVEEVNLQIALEHGQAMTVIVRRADSDVMPVVVMQTATVQDLKSAIKRYFELKQVREEIKKKVSWRYVWRSYYLCFEGEKLTDDYKKIRDYGIRNRAQVTFAKRLHSKGGGY